MEIEAILKSLGLSEKEIRVYLALLKIGLTTAAKVAKAAQLPRQTTYSLLADLVKAEFLEQSDKRGIRQFYADPAALIRLVASRRETLEKQKKVLEEELPKLMKENKRGEALPVVQYYEGQEGLKRLFNSMLDMYKRGKIKSFRGYGINKLYGDMEEYLRSFLEKRDSYGVKTNLFIADAPDDFGIVDETSALGRNVKRLDIEEQQAGIYLVGNNVYLFSYKDHVGVMIENQTIAKYLQDTFDALWEKTPV